ERARHSLYVYIARLRQVLGNRTLLRQAGGYILKAEPECVDVQRFRELCKLAGAAGLEGRIAMLDEALALWRRRPLQDLDGDWVAGVRQSCGRLRMDAAVSWAKARLGSGDPQAVIPLLTELRDEQPLVEPLAAVLMLALHAAGRGAEALSLFAEVRNRLA